jgi:hypothetical protein
MALVANRKLMTAYRFAYRLLQFVLVLGFVMLQNLVSVNALSAAQQKVFRDHINYFNVDVSAVCSNSSTSLRGSDNGAKIWNYFKDKGLSDAQVAGIMGNLKQESGFNPQAVEGGGNSKNPADAGSGGWGLAQWTPGSKVIGIAKDLKVSGPIYELGTQLDIIWGEMTGTSPTGVQNMVETLKQKTTVSDATSYFVVAFEGPKVVGPRLTYAQESLAKYGKASSDSSNDSSSPSDNDCGSTGSPDCASASGTAKILCEAQKYDPVDYVWGGGHAGGVAYHKACSSIKGNNSACGLDCSGLVSVAVYDAFQNTAAWDTHSIVSDHKNWQSISFDEVKPGDLLEPETEHVEIIDHVSGNTIYTFGAHTSNAPQPKQVGPARYTKAAGYQYFRYVGQGA